MAHLSNKMHLYQSRSGFDWIITIICLSCFYQLHHSLFYRLTINCSRYRNTWLRWKCNQNFFSDHTNQISNYRLYIFNILVRCFRWQQFNFMGSDFIRVWRIRSISKFFIRFYFYQIQSSRSKCAVGDFNWPKQQQWSRNINLCVRRQYILPIDFNHNRILYRKF